MNKIFLSSLMVVLFSITLLYAGDVIQTQESDTWDGVEIDLTSLKVKNKVISVKFKIRNTGSDTQSVRIDYRDCYIMDEKNQKKYYVLKDSDNNYIAGPNYDHANGGRFWYDIKPEKSKGMWMKFPEPKDETEEISISIPGMPPFEEVAIKSKD